MLSDCDGTCCRLDIFHDGEFGSICDDSVQQATAVIACRQLGFATEGARVQVGGQGYGATGTTPGTGQIWLDELRCTGEEETIADCPHNPWGNHNCIHAEDLGLCCPGGGNGGTGSGSGSVEVSSSSSSSSSARGGGRGGGRGADWEAGRPSRAPAAAGQLALVGQDVVVGSGSCCFASGFGRLVVARCTENGGRALRPRLARRRR